MSVISQPGRPINPPTAGGSRHTHRMLMGCYLLAPVWGVRNIRPDKPSALDILVPLAVAIILVWWVIVDARRRRHPIPLLARPWLVVFFGLAIPGYIIWSRGWRGLGWIALHFFLWYAVATVTMIVGWLVLYGGTRSGAASDG